jgi:hypothetical protein
MSHNLQHISVWHTDPQKAFDAKQISRMWEIFELRAEDVIELRALWPKIPGESRPTQTRHFYVRQYQSVDACRSGVEATALQLNQDGYNTYVVMNPLRSDFDSRNARKEDVLHRRLLLVDLDRAGSKDDPATAQELDAACAVAKSIMAFTANLGLPEPSIVMSGNGYHLYYRLADLPNTPETTMLIEGALQSLADIFNTDSVEVDTKVSDAGRITKIPGTIARKGKESADRPYRQAVVV